MAITPLPSIIRNDPDFRNKVDVFFETQLPTFTVEVNNLAIEVNNKTMIAVNSAAAAATSVTNAAASATAAEISNQQAQAARDTAVNAANNPSYTGTSTTTHTVGYGSKTFVTQAGRNWSAGMSLRAYSVEGYQMIGAITDYTATNVTINVESVRGYGNTSSSWSLGYYNLESERAAFMWSLIFS